MTRTSTRRLLGGLTYPEVTRAIGNGSVLLLPLGAIEQHGPHLPLDTDIVVAEGLAGRIVDRWGDVFDLWQLPTLAIGLSREHDWAPGTLTLSINGFAAYLRDLAAAIVHSLPVRDLAILNGHGGNRGALESILHELRSAFGLNACVLHPFDLAGGDPSAADVHGGRSETAVMLALAPELVRRDLIKGGGPPDAQAAQALIFNRGASFPWRTDDPRLARDGVIGNAAAATADEGDALIERIVEAAGAVLKQLLEFRAIMSAPKALR